MFSADTLATVGGTENFFRSRNRLFKHTLTRTMDPSELLPEFLVAYALDGLLDPPCLVLHYSVAYFGGAAQLGPRSRI